jgi:hypothetical protein
MNLLQKDNPKRFSQIMQKADEYYSLLDNHQISEPVMFTGGMSLFASSFIAIMLLTGLPLFIVGRIVNYLPFLMIYPIVNKKIQDTQFRSSVYFAATALFVAPFFYMLQATAIVFITGIWWVGLASIPTMLVLGILAYQYLKFWKWAMARWKANIFVKKHKETAFIIKELRKKLMNLIDDSIQKFNNTEKINQQ